MHDQVRIPDMAFDAQFIPLSGFVIHSSFWFRAWSFFPCSFPARLDRASAKKRARAKGALIGPRLEIWRFSVILDNFTLWHRVRFMVQRSRQVTVMGGRESHSIHGARLVPTGGVARPAVGRATRLPGAFKIKLSLFENTSTETCFFCCAQREVIRICEQLLSPYPRPLRWERARSRVPLELRRIPSHRDVSAAIPSPSVLYWARENVAQLFRAISFSGKETRLNRLL